MSSPYSSEIIINVSNISKMWRSQIILHENIISINEIKAE